jgi:hypothetical protein
MSYGETQLINGLLKRLFGGVTPEILIDPETHAELKALARPARSRFYSITIPLWLLGAGLLSWGAIALRLHLDGTPVNAILDERPRWVSLGLSTCIVMGTLWMASMAEFWLLPRMLRWEPELWRRYYATEHGWLPRRQAIFLTILILPMAAFMGTASWNIGDRVDDNAIAFGDLPFTRRIEAYSNVTAIELYSSINAPLGNRGGENLLVRFTAGPPWTYGPDTGNWASARHVAEYIAAHSGKPVQRPGVRP